MIYKSTNSSRMISSGTLFPGKFKRAICPLSANVGSCDAAGGEVVEGGNRKQSALPSPFLFKLGLFLKLGFALFQ